MLLVVRNKAGHFPVFAAEDKGGTDLRPLQISEAEAARELRKNCASSWTPAPQACSTRSRRWRSSATKRSARCVQKLIDTRDPCYGVLFEESGSGGNLIYLPVRYSLHHKYFAKAEVISGVRPAGSYPYDALMRLLDELNAFSAAAKQGPAPSCWRSLRSTTCRTWAGATSDSSPASCTTSSIPTTSPDRVRAAPGQTFSPAAAAAVRPARGGRAHYVQQGAARGPQSPSRGWSTGTASTACS